MRRLSGFSLAPILVLAVGLWLAVAAPAGAHSVVERSSPAPNAALQTAPRQIDLSFSEAIDPTFSSATVRAASGNRVSGQTVISSDGRRMTVPLTELPSGLYTARWRVLSAVDGHTTSGVLVFTIGAVQGPAAAAEGAGAAAITDPWLTAARWVGFLAAGLLAGAAFFAAWVIRPGLREMGSIDTSLRNLIEIRLRSLTVVAALVLLAAAPIELALRAVALTDASLIQTAVSGQLSLLLWGTKPGWSTLVRAAMAVLLLLPASPRGRVLQAAALVWFLIMTGLSALFGGPAALSGSGHLALVVLVGAVYGLVSVLAVIILPQVPDFRVPDLTWIPPLVGAVLLMGFTMTSHAWGTGPLAVLIDWWHLIAVAVWIGSLASLLLVLGRCPSASRGRLCRVLVPRISSLAAVSLGAVVVTGIYSSWLHIPTLRAFLITDYGRALLVKLALVVPLIALGALNRFALHPRLQATGDGEATALRRFLRTVTGEVSLAVIIALVVTVLTNVPPARVTLATSTAAPIAAPTTLQMAGAAGETRVVLTIDPATLGPNELTAVVTERGRPVDADARVLIRLVKLDEDLSPITINLSSQGEGRYAARVGELALPGYWQAEVVVRKRGQLDAAADFPVRLGQVPPPASNPQVTRMFEQARESMASLRAWREVQQLTDGLGNVDVTTVEFVRPDRLRYSTFGGVEGVIIGADRYQRAGTGPWEKQVLPRPITLVGPSQYMQDAQAIARGRADPCEDEPAESCQVLLWQNPSATANFAAWVGTKRHMVHKVLMVAPAHFMTLRVTDFNAALRIDPPK